MATPESSFSTTSIVLGGDALIDNAAPAEIKTEIIKVKLEKRNERGELVEVRTLEF